MEHEELYCSVVIPVYCAEGSLDELVARIQQVIHTMDVSFELILVDDGSSDRSWQVIQKLADLHPEFLVAVRLLRNFGQHNALMCGLRLARGQIVVTMDDDLQNSPEDIPTLIEKIEDLGVDVAYGLPAKRQDAAWRRFGSRVINLFINKAIGIQGSVSSFRAVRRNVVDAIVRYELNYTFIDGLIAWNTDRIAFVKVAHSSRKHGQSGYSLRRLFLHALNIVTNFSLLPLQIASAAGLLSSIFGLSIGAYYLCLALLQRIVVPGYASIIVAILVLGGLQLLALGVIGEYLGRVHLNINRKPQYTIRSVLNYESPNRNTAENCDSVTFNPS